MRGPRRFSQAISEGDGISVLADVRAPGDARVAEAEGAEGIVLSDEVAGVREATELPILWCGPGSVEAAAEVGADACLLFVAGNEQENGRLEQLHAEAVERGLDPVIEVRDEDELRLALDRVDPEILFLAGGQDDERGALEHVLALLPDVPAGKLAVAEVHGATRDEVVELERAGIDAVIVAAGGIAAVVGDAPPPP